MTNNGDAPLIIQSVSLSGDMSRNFAIVSGGEPGVLDPGASRTISVVFAPVVFGSINARLVITTNITGVPREIALDGLGTQGVNFSASISPTSIDFGNQVLGSTSGARTVTLTNTEAASAPLDNVTLTGPDATSFLIVSGGETPGVLARGSSRSVSVAFRPTRAGTHTAALSLYVLPPGAAVYSVYSATLTGASAAPPAPTVSLAPTSLTFEATSPVYFTSPPQSVTVTNTGNASLNISGTSIQGPNAGDFKITSGGEVGSVAPGASRTITLTFTPQSDGNRTATLWINTDAPGSPHTVSLQGVGLVPSFQGQFIVDGSTDFGSQPVGVPSPPKRVTLKNIGTWSGGFVELRLDGAGFSIASDTGEGSLLPGQSRTWTIVFTATAAGPHHAEMLIGIHDNWHRFTEYYGGGFDGSGIGPAVSLSPSSLSFGRQNVGSTSGVQSLTLTNSGQLALSISNISLTGAKAGSFAITAGGDAGSLAPGASRAISVTFSPTTPGDHSAALSIASNAPGSPHQVGLSGTGVIPAPVVSLSPAALGFGDQAVGTTSASQSVTLTNSGDAPLLVSGVGLAGANPGSFSITAGGDSGALAPGASRTISVAFAPTTAGGQTASLAIASNAAGSPHSVALSGSGFVPAPALTLNSTSIDFGSLTVGSTSPPRSVTLTNSGNAPLAISAVSITGADPGSFAISAGGDAGTLAPGSSRTISITFSPTTPGGHSAGLTIASNAPGGPHLVILSGTGLAAEPVVSLTPASLNFGDQPVGTTSAPQNATLTNTGTAPLVISNVEIVGFSYRSFAIVSGGGPGTLAPGESRTITITFTPTAAGINTGNLSVESNAQGSPNLVGLTGMGTTPAPRVSLNPASLDFGAQAVGTTSAPRGITLTNSGSAPLAIGGITVGGANSASFAIVSGGTSGILAAGSSRTISLTFRPGAPGAHSGTLTLVTNAADSPHRVSLSGTGGSAGISASPTSINFGDQALGTRSGERTVTVTNTGSAPLAISGVTLGGDPDFEIVGGGGTATVAAGAAQTIRLTFAPTTVGERRGTLSISHNASGSPSQVSLVGNGKNPTPVPGTPVASVTPASLSFGRQTVGTASSALNVTVANTGTAPLVVQQVAVSGANAPDFRLVSGGPGTLAVGTSRTYSLVFAPQAAGARGAALTITDNAAGSPRAVPLTGIGVEPTPPVGLPGATLAPAGLSFGEQSVGIRGAARAITLTSSGTAPLQVLGIRITGANATDFAVTGGGDNGSLAAGAGREIDIRFTASALGTRGAVLEVRTNASGSPHTVPLVGAGTVAAPAPPSPDWPVFGHDPRQLGLAPASPDPTPLVPWSVTLGGRPGASPVVRDGVAYLGTEIGVFAVDVATHKVRWSQPLSAPVRSTPAAGSGVVVVSAGGLYGLNPTDGTVLWQRPDLVAGDDISPMLAGEVVYLGARAASGGGGVMAAVKALTGANVWPAPVALPAGFEGQGTPAVYPEIGLLFMGLGPTAAAAGRPGAVMALRLEDGSAAWPAPAPLSTPQLPTGAAVGWVAGPNGAQPTDGAQPAVFVAAGNRITALQAVTGAQLWTRSLTEPALVGPPLLSSAGVQGSVLAVIGKSGQVYALNASTGADAPGPVGSPVGAVSGPPALAPPYLFVPTSQALIALDTRNGARAWSSPLSAGSGVAVAGGVPYVATTDTRLVGFSVPPPVIIHDVAIESLQVPARVSRQADAQVRVTLVNRGTGTESYRLLVRVQPGRALLVDAPGTLAPREKKTVSIPWPVFLMGDDGPKSVVALVALDGATDSSPADNNALQVVTVGP
jgi:P pilus assembly chaperone PapD